MGDVRQRRQRQKPRYYNEVVVQELVKLWELVNYSCGKRLLVILPELIAKLEQFGEVRLTANTNRNLASSLQALSRNFPGVIRTSREYRS